MLQRPLRAGRNPAPSAAGPGGNRRSPAAGPGLPLLPGTGVCRAERELGHRGVPWPCAHRHCTKSRGSRGGVGSRCYTGDGASSCSTRADGLRAGTPGAMEVLLGNLSGLPGPWRRCLSRDDPAEGFGTAARHRGRPRARFGLGRIPSNLVQEGRAKLLSFCPSELGS